MTDSSPPPSPHDVKEFRESMTDSPLPSPITHPTLPRSAINKKLFFDFPTPPHSPNSPTTSTFPRGASPRSASFSGGRRPKHIRNDSRSASAKHTRRRSSLSAGFHMSELKKEEYGPPPHPAPTTPLPPVPGAPRIPYTTPAQVEVERKRHSSYNRYSSYELMVKLRNLEQQENDNNRKRHSAPPLRVPQRSLPVPTFVSLDIRRTVSDTAAENDLHAPQSRTGRRRSRGLIISTGAGIMEVEDRI